MRITKVPTHDSNLYKAAYDWDLAKEVSQKERPNVTTKSETNVFIYQRVTCFSCNTFNSPYIRPCPWSLPITAAPLSHSPVNLNWAHNCLSSMGFSPCRPQIYTLLPIPSNDVESISFKTASEKLWRITSLKQTKHRSGYSLKELTWWHKKEQWFLAYMKYKYAVLRGQWSSFGYNDNTEAQKFDMSYALQ